MALVWILSLNKTLCPWRVHCYRKKQLNVEGITTCIFLCVRVRKAPRWHNVKTMAKDDAVLSALVLAKCPWGPPRSSDTMSGVIHTETNKQKNTTSTCCKPAKLAIEFLIDQLWLWLIRGSNHIQSFTLNWPFVPKHFPILVTRLVTKENLTLRFSKKLKLMTQPHNWLYFQKMFTSATQRAQEKKILSFFLSFSTTIYILSSKMQPQGKYCFRSFLLMI